ncbi:MAG: metallophosphoesterase [Microcoleus sp. PH2017_10_PVI_O_A]|uniref:metallophosphoesterase family protein n=1 Tax=unclassified Microcoleus TaxID=2642155 RepID=UPI001D8D71A8|nr:MULTISPECIES: metallophosphoesterase [unclassified Microcoleus]TAE75374.1 MAG: metallophosphoesterase [Oscillatoriales cyanobacterium]MCC3408319.1 metallophosphoesterase [Microcoleus sp. PH2017_10_PVI_O_A]MCC3461609.1 metallophosphoesterase [Microcoleus sp. PH2017_11_PCY_U_A]MCC3480880.1 metallophosphoesterase [Microcoleus sp. PH2017_12_PCY_D_A]MCC3530787.1 metallophosphoesterase [Microcoleus sp. PH2017_21_RUC_O_A]
MLTPLPDKLGRPQGSSRNLWFFAVLILIVLFLGLIMQSFLNKPKLLTDPFLQLPTTNSVRVVWFTEFPGTRNIVAYGENLSKIATANTTKLSRTREDKDSNISDEMKQGIIDNNPIVRHIWRHEAEVTNLIPGVRIPYLVTSETKNGESVSSKVFSLSPTPAAGIKLKILFTSDHQLMPMTAANLQKVAETIDKVDAVFMAGDLINIADRASEWFDDDRGRAFFPSFQGRAFSEIDKNGIKTVYSGGELIQHAPLFPTIGNHEIMGRFSTSSSLNDQFNDSFPRAAVEKIYPYLTKKYGMKDQDVLLKNNSFNSDTYNEIFSLPSDKNYYAVTFGDVRLVTLYVTNIWRTPNLDPGAKGRYRERDEDFDRPEKWGYGQHIFEPIVKGSAQYAWLEQELYSAEFQQAKYKIVMFHHPPHSLGDNIVPAYTDPVQIVDRTSDGEIKMVRYEYPKQQDYLIRDVVPLLETAGVQLVLYGHSHLWNRFVSSSGMHFLETSNVGNSYGAFAGRKRRFVPPGYQEDYSAIGDPNGLEPVMPTVAPLLGKDGLALPYIDSNDITAFSVFDTGNGTVSSYYFDTRKPKSEVVKFDEFKLKKS